jgi:nucleoid DNA-binding protein
MAAEKGKKSAAVRESFTKAQLFAAISEETGLPKKEVANVYASLTDIIQRHLKSRGPGVFTLPGIAKLTVAKKKATKARKGINPFNGEEIMIPAKPARRVVKVRALKGLKAMADA